MGNLGHNTLARLFLVITASNHDFATLQEGRRMHDQALVGVTPSLCRRKSHADG